MIDITTVRHEDAIVFAFAAKYPKLGVDGVQIAFKAEINAACAAWREWNDSCLRAEVRSPFTVAIAGTVMARNPGRGTRKCGGVRG